MCVAKCVSTREIAPAGWFLLHGMPAVVVWCQSTHDLTIQYGCGTTGWRRVEWDCCATSARLRERLTAKCEPRRRSSCQTGLVFSHHRCGLFSARTSTRIFQSTSHSVRSSPSRSRPRRAPRSLRTNRFRLAPFPISSQSAPYAISPSRLCHLSALPSATSFGCGCLRSP
ncbi:hypothetical protein C8Q77DRAFT_697407 [Trametes polyzona]|nr:hypothetical protein C8Q77DRAFT_697407 [Trametes polyzona]